MIDGDRIYFLEIHGGSLKSTKIRPLACQREGPGETECRGPPSALKGTIWHSLRVSVTPKIQNSCPAWRPSDGQNAVVHRPLVEHASGRPSGRRPARPHPDLGPAARGAHALHPTAGGGCRHQPQHRDRGLRPVGGLGPAALAPGLRLLRDRAGTAVLLRAGVLQPQARLRRHQPDVGPVQQREHQPQAGLRLVAGKLARDRRLELRHPAGHADEPLRLAGLQHPPGRRDLAPSGAAPPARLRHPGRPEPDPAHHRRQPRLGPAGALPHPARGHGVRGVARLLQPVRPAEAAGGEHGGGAPHSPGSRHGRAGAFVADPPPQAVLHQQRAAKPHRHHPDPGRGPPRAAAGRTV